MTEATLSKAYESGINGTAHSAANNTVSAAAMYTPSTHAKHRRVLQKRAVCRTLEAQSGQGDCVLLASLCGIFG